MSIISANICVALTTGLGVYVIMIKIQKATGMSPTKIHMIKKVNQTLKLKQFKNRDSTLYF